MSEPNPSAQLDLKVSRGYAHFHRLLSSILEDLTEVAEVVWIGDVLARLKCGADVYVNTETGHNIGGDSEPNVYRKAVYVVDSLSPWQERIDELIKVQNEVCGIFSYTKPPSGLLQPVLIPDVVAFRIKPQLAHYQSKHKPHIVAAEVRETLFTVKTNARRFEAVLLDDQTQRLYDEIKTLEASLELLSNESEPVLVRRALYRGMVRVYPRSQKSKEVYVRDEGLILQGQAHLEPSVGRRQRRSDRLVNKVEPIVTFNNVSVYRLEEWQSAKVKT